MASQKKVKVCKIELKGLNVQMDQVKGEEEAWAAQVREMEHKVVEWGQKVKWLSRRAEERRGESFREIHGEVSQLREER